MKRIIYSLGMGVVLLLTGCVHEHGYRGGGYDHYGRGYGHGHGGYHYYHRGDFYQREGTEIRVRF